MKSLTTYLLCVFFSLALRAQDRTALGKLPLPADSSMFLVHLKTLGNLPGRLQPYYQFMPDAVTLLNCQENQIDLWRLRRCCTNQAAYAWQDTVRVTATDRITNWNTWPWTFSGTTKAVLAAGDTIPHTVNLILVNASGDTLLNWETTIPIGLIPGDWSYEVWFLQWVETTRTLELVNFQPGTYTLVAELRATGYWGVSIEVQFSIDYLVPVETTSFTAVAADNDVILTWVTATELNNSGFYVQRRSASTTYATVSNFIVGGGTTNVPQTYSYTDHSLLPGLYQYRLEQHDFNGSISYYGPIEVQVGHIPSSPVLEQNCPNPFNPTTAIRYALPEAAQVKLVVYNLLGQQVRMLVDQYVTVGNHEISFDGQGLPNGTYFYKLTAGDYVGTKKMSLLK